MKVTFIIYADLEWLLQKMSTSYNYLKKIINNKINKHGPPGYLLFTRCSFDATKSTLDCYGGKDCMEEFCFKG